MTLNSRSALAIAVRVRSILPCNKIQHYSLPLPRLRRSGCSTPCHVKFQSTALISDNRSFDENNVNPTSLPSIPTESPSSAPHVKLDYTKEQWLPASCPGCGALAQSLHSTEAGYYSRSRKAVKTYIHENRGLLSGSIKPTKLPSLDNEPNGQLEDEGTDSRSDPVETSPTVGLNQVEVPICDRCHDLIYNNKGHSIAHPTIEALTDSIAESPFRRNHIYHVLDAVDFPMSLIPKIFQSLEIAKLRGQNRRARTRITSKPTISFIITRSDLLGPSKEMVDRLMPYYQGVLRSALGRYGRDIRLGNVHLVSAKRGWWTKDIKDSIWERGGGNWMVGKANVGKSNLFPVLFPKGSGDRAPVYAELQDDDQQGKRKAQSAKPDDFLEVGSLLPPAQPEVAFPSMPLVSHLPGTTASPIRLPFGNHKGELIDLPGLDRGNLEEHVRPENKLDLVMKRRPNVKQYIVKHGQSLILGGGLVRITPELDEADRSTTLLAYPFVPIDAHITSTEKAVALEREDREIAIKSILAEGAGATLRSSGTFTLETDVTKVRAGPLMRAGVRADQLPFRIYASDILIEGVGWVEVACQVRRRKRLEMRSDDTGDTAVDFRPFFEHSSTRESETPGIEEFPFPKVEVFSPHGKHIGQRPTLGAWNLWERHKELRRGPTNHVRPRKSMKGAKKNEKRVRRAEAANEMS